MSVVPVFSNDRFWDPWRSSRFLDRHFRPDWDFDDFWSPFNSLSLRHPSESFSKWRPSELVRRSWRPLGSSTTIDPQATITSDNEKFQVNVDVQDFKPHEINVKVNGDTITVEGKHEERPDDHEFVSKQFHRRYVLPQTHDTNAVSSNLSPDGILTITAPRYGPRFEGNRSIPIQYTSSRSREVDFKKSY